MRYLVDTQIFIWTLISPKKLSMPTRQILQNHEIFVSQVSVTVGAEPSLNNVSKSETYLKTVPASNSEKFGEL